MTERIFNFSAGPAVIPVPVLEEAQRDMLALPGVGMSVMEISHRSKTFDEIISGADAGLRELLNIPKDYAVLFLQGGASLQFAMVPMNFLSLDRSADYIVTGSWGKKAVKEAQKFGHVNFAANTADGGFTRVPAQDELQLDPAPLTCTSLRTKRSKASSSRANLKSAMCRWSATLHQTFFRGPFRLRNTASSMGARKRTWARAA